MKSSEPQVLIIDNATTCAMRVKTLINMHEANALLVHWSDWDYFVERSNLDLNPCLLIFEQSIPQYLMERVIELLPNTPLFLLLTDKSNEPDWLQPQPINPLPSNLTDFEVLALLEPYWSEERNINLPAVLILDNANESSFYIHQQLSEAGIPCQLANRLNPSVLEHTDMLVVNIEDFSKRKNQITKLKKTNSELGVICYGKESSIVNLEFVQFAVLHHLDLVLTHEQLTKRWLIQFYRVWRKRAEEKEAHLIAKKFETSLTRLLEKSLVMRVLFENSMDGVVCFDEQGQILKCNKGFSELLGVQLNKVKQENLFNWFAPQSKSDLRLATEERQFVQQQVLELQVKHQQNIMIPVSVSINKVNVQGDFVFVAVLRNNTSYHLQKKLLVQKNVQLDHKSKQLKQRNKFVENQTIIKERKRNAFSLKVLDFISNTALPQADIEKKLSNIQTYFQLKLGQQEKVKTLESLKLHVGSTIEKFEDMLTSREIVISLAELRDVHIHINKEHLDKLLFELFDNCIRYSMKGSSIQVSSYLDDEVTKLAIADTGIGMLEQNKAMLLDMEEANLHCKTGLHTGLPLIKALAEYNDCEIVIEDSYNNMQTTGSKFTLCIPTV